MKGSIGLIDKLFLIIKNMKSPKWVEIDLLNSEGPIFKLRRTEGELPMSIIIVDQWKTECGVYKTSEIMELISGNMEVVDSRGTVYNWKVQPKETKTGIDKIKAFLGI